MVIGLRDSTAFNGQRLSDILIPGPMFLKCCQNKDYLVIIIFPNFGATSST